MTSEEVTADVRRFLRQKGNRIKKIKIGRSGLPKEINGDETRAQQRARIKRTHRSAEIFAAGANRQ